MILLDIMVLCVFAVMLIACILMDFSILYALAAGFFLFFFYCMKKGFSFRQVLCMCFESVKTARNVLITFVLIGMLTGLWRAAGTIPSIVCYAVNLITPGIFTLLTFLLCCFISFLTGTAFGSAATMGAICMTMALALDMNPVVMGGAILSGVYFGDRCSPVSTSALLTAEITGTDLHDNIRGMVRTAAIPFLLSCLIYLILGWVLPCGTGAAMDVSALFRQAFRPGIVPLIPAAVILIFACFRIPVKITMLASILASTALCILRQHMGVVETLQVMLLGYHATDAALAGMLDGGGIVSMLKVAVIVCIASCYSGMFQKTGLLNSLKHGISRFSTRTTPFAAMLLTSVLAGAVACNQTLTIMLTQQLCEGIEPDKETLAMDLENSAVMIAPLIPWSIAGGVPLSSVGAPTLSLLASCYLYLLPVCNLITQCLKAHVRKK